MRTTIRAGRGDRRAPLVLVRLVAVLAAALVTLTTLSSVPAAAADQEICGHTVRGEILAKYLGMGGWDSQLKCPTTEELPTPDGRGAYTVFEGGSIYWSEATGAHPVWGAVRDAWARQGWEGGKFGYPVGDELQNPDARGIRQQFQGGTFYWHPTKTARAYGVSGRIGQLWGQWGYERGAFGYPTSDEYNTDAIGGSDSQHTGVRQNFEYSRFIVWTSGHSDGYYVCRSECVGYGGMTNKAWVAKTEVYHSLASGPDPYAGLRSVHVTPTEAGFSHADDHLQELWGQVWSVIPSPSPAFSADEQDVVSKQLYCHSVFAFTDPFGDGRFGGPTWDLETWRPNWDWDSYKWLRVKCNPGWPAEE